MTLVHTPAHIIEYPDMWVDRDTDTSYVVSQDVDAEDPRTWIDDKYSAIYVYCSRDPQLIPENIACEAFDRFYQHAGADERTALALTRRWLNIWHPSTPYHLDIGHIHVNSEQYRVFAAVAPGYGTPNSEIEIYRQWAAGEVWTVATDTDSLSGIYADSPEQALAEYREYCAAYA